MHVLRFPPQGLVFIIGEVPQEIADLIAHHATLPGVTAQMQRAEGRAASPKGASVPATATKASFNAPLEDTQGLHCKYPGQLHTIPYDFVIRNCMEPSRRLFFISLGAADFVTYDQREVFFPTPFCQENVII